MDRRQYLALVGAGGIATVAGCLGDDDDGDDDPDNDSDDSLDDDSDNDSESANLQRDHEVEFSGSGGAVTDTFDLSAGLTICEAIFESQGNHDIELLNPDGNLVNRRIFVGRANEFAGEQASVQDGGTYLLDISTPGDWRVGLIQPRPQTGDDVPNEISGTSDQVLGPYLFSGSYEITAVNNANGFLQASVWEPEGEPGFGSETVVQNVETSDETLLNFEGIAFLEVKGQDWTLVFS